MHQPRYFAGSSLLFAGRIADALPLLQRAVDLDPRLGMPWLGLGSAHLSLAHLREARYCFERARALEDEAIRFETTGADAYVADVLRVEGCLDDARRRVLTGLESVERSDHAYRDTFRAYALVVLGQTALDQRDLEAARAAFGQVLAQAQGRPRTRSCGQLVVRAMVGLAAASGSVELYEQAAHLYAERNTYNFEPFFGALDHQALFEIARVAQILGRSSEAIALLERGRKVGETRSLPLSDAHRVEDDGCAEDSRGNRLTQRPLALAEASPFSCEVDRQTAAHIPGPCIQRSHPAARSLPEVSRGLKDLHRDRSAAASAPDRHHRTASLNGRGRCARQRRTHRQSRGH